MSDRLQGSFNVYTLIPVFHDKSGFWCTEPTKHDTFIDYSQSDLDIMIKNTFESQECRALIVVHKAFDGSELRTFIRFVDCDEQVLIELLKRGKLKELIL